MGKKYELVKDDIKKYYGHKLYRIRTLKDFGNIKKGNIGGYIEKEENLSHKYNCWVYDDAKVFGNAVICGNARIYGNAEMYGNAEVWDYARIYGNANVYEHAIVFGNAKIGKYAYIGNHTNISLNALISSKDDFACIGGFSEYIFTTFYRCEDGSVRVNCGCFNGTLDEFRAHVRRTREGYMAKEYLMTADLMEKRFKNKK